MDLFHFKSLKVITFVSCPKKSEFGDLVTMLLDDNVYFMEITISFLQIKVTN